MVHEALDSDDIASITGEDGADGRPRRRGWMGWLISAGFHLALVAVLGTVYWVIHTEVDTPPLAGPPPFRPAEPPKTTPTPQDPKIVKTLPDPDAPEANVDDPHPVSQLAVPPDADDDTLPDPTDTAPGRPDTVAEIETGGSGILIAIGAAQNSAGPFSQRPGPGGPRRGPHGGRTPHGKEKFDAIRAALRWFKRHQSPDGGWDASRYALNCSDQPKCEPGSTAVAGDANVAMTGYAVMCYLGYGIDHQSPSEFRTTVARGLQHLLAVQHADGQLGERNYEHAIAAKALIEAYGMTCDPVLKEPAQKAVDIIIARQNQDAHAPDRAYGAFGWDYVGPSDRNDSSVTGWNVMALKSALGSGLNVGNALIGARQWLRTTWQAANPGWEKLDPYRGESRFPYTISSSSGAVDIAPAPAEGAPAPDSKDLACVGLMSAVFLGSRSGDPMLETLARYVDRHEFPAGYPCNTYKLYYDCLGAYQVGGAMWKRWDDQVVTLLVGAQRQDGCFAGSWDPQGTRFHGNEVGRVLSTAYCCLSLEACYLYQRVMGKER
jgi:hypothetical protein